MEPRARRVPRSPVRLLTAGVALALGVAALTAVPAASAAVPAAAPAVSSAAKDAPVLKKGDRGKAVKVLQTALEIDRVTGYFGPVTHRAVVAFQQANDLKANGVVDQFTWEALGPDVAREASGQREGYGDVSVDGRYCPAVNFTYGDGYGAPRGGRSHMGVDLMGKMGSPIYAVDSGKVTRSGYQSNGAMILDITHKSGRMWFYGHFDEIYFKEGDKVEAGQLIGTMGDTGSPGAVHLHIELRPQGWSGAADPDIENIIRGICGD